MRVPSSLKVILCTWIAALVGALAGRGLAEVTSAPSAAHGSHAHAVTAVQSR
jgi:hypothetical protein